MAQALFSLQATSMEVHECGDRVDPPSAAMIAAVGRIAQGGCQEKKKRQNSKNIQQMSSSTARIDM